MHPTNCLNCGSSLNMGYKFCATCGQKTNTHRLSLHEIGHDALHHVTHADKGLLYLLRELVVRPGVVAREYIEGKRVKYFKPVNFFLIVCGVLVFMTSYFHYANDTFVKHYENIAANAKDPVERKLLYGQVERSIKATHYLEKYSNVVTMLLTPLFAFILWLFYIKAGYSFIEHLVANLYFSSFTSLCYALVLVPWQKQLAVNYTGWIFILGFMFLQVLYGAVAYYQFINKRGVWPFFKALGVYMFTVFFWIKGSSFVLDYYIMTGF